MNGAESLFSYIETVYENLDSKEIFSRAKEYAWQTFFHHTVSVATISYRLGSIIKKYALSIVKKALESIEKGLGLKYEDILFLTGIGHDYVKLYGIEGRTGEERTRNLLHRIVSNLFILIPDTKEKLISKVITLARAVEGKYTPELEEEYILYVTPVVRVADELMGKKSIDEALVYLQTSKEVRELSENYGIKFGFVKTSLPSILHVKVSEKIVEVLSRNGWTPLVTYADGLILVGTKTSKTVPMREVAKVVKSEIAEAFETEERIREIITGLKKLQLNEIYAKLVQTKATTLLPVNEEKLKERDRETIGGVYHNLIVKYLKGTSISDLDKEIRELKSKLKRGTLLDPRSLGTGISGRGSTYFKEKLATMITSKEDLVNTIMSIENEGERFLILSYMVVFPSKEENDVVDILRKALNVVIPKGIDTELIRIVAIAEVYKHINDEKAIRKLIEVTYEKLGGSEDIDYYASKFIITRLKSNIINTELLSSLDILSKGLLESKNYCRICGEQILRPSIRFIQYAQAVKRGGGASEIWLHDDPPLANLEKIATEKRTSIRYICPLCYYEATQLKGRYSPPFFVVALHPVVAYDLWSFLKNRLAYLSNIYELIERRTSEIVLIYGELLDKKKKNMKVAPDILSKIAERELPSKGRAKEERVVVLFDSLGARAILPLGRDMSLKKRDVALALALAPFVMSLSGGGQVGLAGNLGDVYNLGSEIAPVVIPHPSNIVLSIVKSFEEIRKSASMMKRQMTLDEYSVYNRSYVTLLEALYIYGLKIFCWYDRWKRKNSSKKKIEDYALAIHEFMSSIPYVPLALDAPPPEKLDPREGDEPLPYYSLISSKSSEVESCMSQIPKILEGKETPSLNKLLYRYAVSLKELDAKLSKYKVQRPLRKGIELLLQLTPSLGEADAKGIAIDKFLELLAYSVGVDLETKMKKIRDQEGKEKEVSYRAVFFDIFNELVDILMNIKKKLPPSQVRKLVEVMLDSAYEKYKYVKL
ncbi:MAG: hypothetical protein DRN04_11110 [Thermoprotei archaeon]|nr:MAG: hypothetical protein DRN04_11110 [Thermoprotei archaeon]